MISRPVHLRTLRLVVMPASWHRLHAVDRLCILISTIGLLLGSALAAAVWHWQDGQLQSARRSLDDAVTAETLEKSRVDALARALTASSLAKSATVKLPRSPCSPH